MVINNNINNNNNNNNSSNNNNDNNRNSDNDLNYDDNCSDTIVVTIYGKRIDSLLKKSLHNMQKLCNKIKIISPQLLMKI